MENATKIDEDEAEIETPDIELEEMMGTIDETLKKTENLATKLGDLNKEMVSYMYEYAQTKAGNKYVLPVYPTSYQTVNIDSGFKYYLTFLLHLPQLSFTNFYKPAAAEIDATENLRA